MEELGSNGIKIYTFPSGEQPVGELNAKMNVSIQLLRIWSKMYIQLTSGTFTVVIKSLSSKCYLAYKILFSEHSLTSCFNNVRSTLCITV